MTNFEKNKYVCPSYELVDLPDGREKAVIPDFSMLLNQTMGAPFMRNL